MTRKHVTLSREEFFWRKTISWAKQILNTAFSCSYLCYLEDFETIMSVPAIYGHACFLSFVHFWELAIILKKIVEIPGRDIAFHSILSVCLTVCLKKLCKSFPRGCSYFMADACLDDARILLQNHWILDNLCHTCLLEKYVFAFSIFFMFFRCATFYVLVISFFFFFLFSQF